VAQAQPTAPNHDARVIRDIPFIPDDLPLNKVSRERLSSFFDAYAKLASDLAVNGPPYDETVELCEAVLVARRRLHGEDHWKTVEAQLALDHWRRVASFDEQEANVFCRIAELEAQAVASSRLSRHVESVEKLSEALRLIRTLLGEEDPDCIRVLDDLGTVCALAGDDDRCKAIRKQVVCLQRKSRGSCHPYLADSLVALAYTCNYLEDYAEAQAALQEAYRIYQQVFGETHRRCAELMCKLGVTYLDQEEYAAAESCLQKSVEILGQLGLRGSVVYAESMGGLAEAKRAQGRYAEALKALECAKTIYRREENAECRYVEALCLEALTREQLGEFSRAEALLKEASRLAHRAKGPTDLSFLRYQQALGNVYACMGRYARAKELLQMTRQSLGEVLGTEHATYASCTAFLGDVCRLQGDYSEAERLLKQALAVHAKASGEESLGYEHACELLGLLYLDCREHRSAEPLLLRVRAIREKKLGKDHPDSASVISHLGRLYLAQGRFAEAEARLLESLDIHKKSLGESHPEYLEALQTYAELLRQSERPAEAEKLDARIKEIKKQQKSVEGDPTKPVESAPEP
jgi:tetratricopeptide (TPR) repeat protein